MADLRGGRNIGVVITSYSIHYTKLYDEDYVDLFHQGRDRLGGDDAEVAGPGAALDGGVEGEEVGLAGDLV